MLFKNLKQALAEREQVTGLKLSLKEKKLPDELFVFPNLRELYLDASELTELPHELELPKLQLLQLKAPKFKNSLTAVFNLPSLENLKTLETPLYPLRLSLGHTLAPLRFVTLKDAKLKELPFEFGDLKTLEELHLPNNLFTDLPLSFKALQKLKRLNLDHNKFERFPEILTHLKGLKHLSLDSNPFPELEIERIQREHHITVS